MTVEASTHKRLSIQNTLITAIAFPKKLVKAVIYAVRAIFRPVLRPVEKGANRIAKQLNPMESLVKCVEDFKPIVATEMEKFTSATTSLAQSGEKLSNTGEKLSNMGEQLTSSLQDIAYKAAYLATSVVGLYIYDMALRRQGMQDPIGPAQQIVGIALALGAGAQWGYSVAKSHDLI